MQSFIQLLMPITKFIILFYAIRYADDTVLLADTEERLQELIDRLDEEGRAIGLEINIGRTEVMGAIKRTKQLRVEAHVNGEAARQVSSFRYLGSLIFEDGRCDTEIKSRIAMAKGNFGKMRRILTNLSLGMNIPCATFRLHGAQGGTPGWGAEHTALHPSRGKENVSRRRRNRGLVARRGTRGGRRRNGGGKGWPPWTPP